MIPLHDDQPRFSTPYVNYFLIGLNILIYFFQWALEAADPRNYEILIRQFAVEPSHLTALLSGSPKYTLPAVVIPYFTSMFLHSGWEHVLGNMLYLYIFGDNVEDYLGHVPYLVFYLVGGLIAMGTQAAIYPHSNMPTVGASGAIAAVLGAYFVLYPGARVLTWFFVFVMYLPAWIILGYWFVLNFLSGTATVIAYHGRSVGGVAFWAHIGGFVAGLGMIKLFPQRRRRSPYAYR